MTAALGGVNAVFHDSAAALVTDGKAIAAAALFALSRPTGIELREALVAPATESSRPR